MPKFTRRVAAERAFVYVQHILSIDLKFHALTLTQCISALSFYIEPRHNQAITEQRKKNYRNKLYKYKI